MTATTLAAYYYPAKGALDGRKGNYELHRIEPNGARHILAQNVRCDGKREARRLAALDGATPWNF